MVTFPDINYGPEKLREQAERHDRLAKAAEADGDRIDAINERRKAAELRRQARQYEVK